MITHNKDCVNKWNNREFFIFAIHSIFQKNSCMKKLFFFFILQFFLLVAFGQSFRVGDKVEVFNSGGWYAATIQQSGTGDYNGYYYVKYEKYSQGQWIKGTNIRLKSSSDMPAADGGPRNGQYIILSYGDPSNPMRLGYFYLNNGKYSYYNLVKKLIGEGSYSFNKASNIVDWKSGPFKNANWTGYFEIDRGGKTHKIRLNRVTIGSNSTDSN